MQYIYLKPQLQNLSQGERIAFVRQFRRMTQDEVSDKLGLDGENKRRSMARYESGDRKPKENRLLEISNILKVNPKIIKEYNFQNQEDLIYMLLWLDEKYQKKDLLDVAQKYGKFYLLQDNLREDGLTDISIIKSTDGTIEFYYENDGKIWEVSDDIRLISRSKSNKRI